MPVAKIECAADLVGRLRRRGGRSRCCGSTRTIEPATSSASGFEQARQQQRQQQGEQFDPREFESADSKRKVLDR